jgi:dihydroorotate dehydrogenase
VSSANEKKKGSKSTGRRIKNIILGTSLVLALGAGYIYGTDTRASAHRWIIPPLMRWLYPDAEDAHHAGVEWLKFLYRFGLHPRERGNPDSTGKLATQVAHPARLCSEL